MAPSDYTRGSMDISDQARTWKGFMTASTWSTLIILLVVAYATFTLTMGMNWLVALVLCAGGGLIAGVLLGLGGAWIGTVIALSVLAIFIEIVIALFKLIL